MIKPLLQSIFLLAVVIGIGSSVMFWISHQPPPAPVTQQTLTLIPTAEISEPLSSNVLADSQQMLASLDNGDGDRSKSERLAQQAKLKRVGLIYDRMEPSACAKIFVQMSKDNLNELSVKLLSTMSDRPVAKVLAEISKSDANLAVDLIEKLQAFKSSKSPARQDAVNPVQPIPQPPSSVNP